MIFRQRQHAITWANLINIHDAIYCHYARIFFLNPFILYSICMALKAMPYSFIYIMIGAMFIHMVWINFILHAMIQF